MHAILQALHVSGLGLRAPRLDSALKFLALQERARMLKRLLLETSMANFLGEWSKYRGHQAFKFHMCLHVAEQRVEKGNPTAYWTCPDENENRLMGTVAKSLHGGSTFYVRFLDKVIY